MMNIANHSMYLDFDFSNFREDKHTNFSTETWVYQISTKTHKGHSNCYNLPSFALKLIHWGHKEKQSFKHKTLSKLHALTESRSGEIHRGTGGTDAHVPMVGAMSSSMWAAETKLTRRLLLPTAESPMSRTLKEQS